jgi:cytoskeletal protein CcmA (bactofilin family)
MGFSITLSGIVMSRAITAKRRYRMAFWSKKKKSTTPAARDQNGEMPAEETLIGQGWRLKGRVYGKGTVVFQQAFEGELEIQGRLTIDSSAAVKGMFRSEEIHIRGTVEGSLEGTRMVTLETSARVDGDVTTPRLQMMAGAYLNGNLTMEAPQASLKRQRT